MIGGPSSFGPATFGAGNRALFGSIARRCRTLLVVFAGTASAAAAHAPGHAVHQTAALFANAGSQVFLGLAFVVRSAFRYAGANPQNL